MDDDGDASEVGGAVDLQFVEELFWDVGFEGDDVYF